MKVKLSENDDLAFDIGMLFTEARYAKSYTQEKLAEKMDTSQPAIARWEGGGSLPSISTLQKLAKVSGLEITITIHERKETKTRLKEHRR